MKSLTLLWRQVLQECGTWCRICTDKDWNTALVRFKHEGLSFFTITLSNFGKDFEKSLDQGFVGDDQFAGFSRTGGLPRFLGGFLRLVFEADGTAILPDPSADAILSIRQITLMLGKLEVPCSETRNRKAVDGYVQVEAELRERDRDGHPGISPGARRVFALLFGNALYRASRQVRNEGPAANAVEHPWGSVRGLGLPRGGSHYPVPRHGPGATADRLFGNSKFRSLEWTERLESVFPSVDFLVPNERYATLLSEARATLLDPGSERPVKVTLVPKTLKTPRIIAEEPTAMMYAQQAVLRLLDAELADDKIIRQFVTLHDQMPNRRMAMEGSRTGALATLDLSEASDRVSNSLVRDLFSSFPAMAAVLDATRSRKASVPYGHGVIRLAKYASMGSALTFPIESMIFLWIIFVSWEEHIARPLQLRDIMSLRGKVRVFGDDMIVPADLVPCVIRNLESFGFKVNANKSFWTGKFRESCGGDYYDGHDVSIVRIRKLFPTRRKDAEEVEALVSLRNRFYYAGFWATCQWLDGQIEEILPHFPVIHHTSEVLGRCSVLPYRAQRTNSMHQPLVRGFVTRAPLPENPVDGPAALLKFFLLRGEEPLDEGHLERSGRPRTVDIKARWTLPY